ncbi:MAG: helix-turn-helix transcriptional regulator [Acidobacteriota bacterium]|nr:helix-turn-helix transcriptional regulator [Acidobacteriota bacterium]
MPAGATIEVLAEPSRRQILDELRKGERPVQALVAQLSMSQPTVSKHLRVLRDAGLVSVRPDGQRRFYRVRPEPLIELDEWLEPYRRTWRASLDKLERHLARPARPSRRTPS